MKYLLMLTLLTGCCSNGTLKTKVKSLCDNHGGLHAIHFTRVKGIECGDGSVFDVNKVKKG